MTNKRRAKKPVQTKCCGGCKGEVTMPDVEPCEAPSYDFAEPRPFNPDERFIFEGRRAVLNNRVSETMAVLTYGLKPKEKEIAERQIKAILGLVADLAREGLLTEFYW